MSARNGRTRLLTLLIGLILLSSLVSASIYQRRLMTTEVLIQGFRAYYLDTPPYNITCVGVSPAGRVEERYINFTLGVPLDWVMINGSRTIRGLVGVSGYWDNVTIYGLSGLRGFPIVWQVREHQTYTEYNPDVRFIPRSPEGISIDSWTAGSASLGNGYLFAILPVELINNTILRNRFDVWFTWGELRRLGTIDIVNRTVTRFDDTYFRAYGNWVPPWEQYAEPYYRVYTVVNRSGYPHVYDITNTTVIPAGYGPYVTYAYAVTDYWTAQSLRFDVFYILFNHTAVDMIVNFTYPFNRYTVILERNGTLNDFGYLDFGVAGLTVSYLNTTMISPSMISTTLASIEGAGFGGIALVDSALRNMYLFVVNNTNGQLVAYRLIGTNFSLITSTPIPGFVNRTFYNMTLYYTLEEGLVRFNVALYHLNGSLITWLNGTDTAIFTIMYSGLAVYTWNRTYTDFIFRDFRLIPHVILVRNVPLNYTIEIYDQNVLRARNTSRAPNATVDVPVPFGQYYVGNRMVTRYPNNITCLDTRGISIYNGDIYVLRTAPILYNLTTGEFNVTISLAGNYSVFILVNVTINTTRTVYARLYINPSSIIGVGLTAEFYLVNSTGYISSPIKIVDGVVVDQSTSPYIELGGSGNYILVNATNKYPTYSYLSFTLKLCSSIDEAICGLVFLKVNLAS